MFKNPKPSTDPSCDWCGGRGRIYLKGAPAPSVPCPECNPPRSHTPQQDKNDGKEG